MTATALATFERRDRRDLAIREGVDDQQYLTFHLAGEHYGLDILKVQEIRGWTPVTVVPNIPAAMRGVLNLRGSIVPVIDLRVQFGLASATCDKTTVVIVTWTWSADGGRTMGMVVDGVSDVLQVRLSEIQPPPDFGAVVDTAFISGLVSTETGMTMLLDVDRLLGSGDSFNLDLPGSGSAVPRYRSVS